MNAATTPSIADKRREFWELHRSGCFVIPNPWDIGSAQYLQRLGFKALASTSAGLAWSKGRSDSAVTLDMTLEHLSEMAAATTVPLAADFGRGFGSDAAEVEQNVRMAITTGIAGLSIEDATGDRHQPLFAIPEACARLRAARNAIDKAGGDVLLVGRAECFSAGNPDLDETTTRLKAYASVGADCLYAPGLDSREHIVAVVEAVYPKPVNLLVASDSKLTMAEIAALGVRRVSVGGALARAAWTGFTRAARQLAQAGRFDGFANLLSSHELNQCFGHQQQPDKASHQSQDNP